MKIQGFNWDKGNIEKVQKHGLTIEEIENFLENNPLIYPDAENSQIETRFFAFDKVKDKLLFVVIYIEGCGWSFKSQSYLGSLCPQKRMGEVLWQNLKREI